ncbi:hypothetical protein WJX72_002974 [[Myrmecia] bisecta]|uniref:C3H1-type domain-containing protein n=1 Tax=[Myrmecia] bisecta TaxID=41462 RepID=A0AAW1R575_9CHLO
MSGDVAAKRARADGGNWVAGGELGDDSVAGSLGSGPGFLKRTIIDILQPGETVPSALKRLRPTSKQALGSKRKAEGQQQGSEDQAGGGQSADQQAEEEKLRLFNTLTEAANELMTLGFEDIYTDTREKVAATLDEGFNELQGKSQYVWHDDGTVANDAATSHVMYQRDRADDVTTFQGLQNGGGSGSAPQAANGHAFAPAANTEPGGQHHATNPAPNPGSGADLQTTTGDAPPGLEGGPHAKFKTQLCRFNAQKRCTKGDQCTYAHDLNEIPENLRQKALWIQEQQLLQGPGGYPAGPGRGSGPASGGYGRGGGDYGGRLLWLPPRHPARANRYKFHHPCAIQAHLSPLPDHIKGLQLRYYA